MVFVEDSEKSIYLFIFEASFFFLLGSTPLDRFDDPSGLTPNADPLPPHGSTQFLPKHSNRPQPSVPGSNRTHDINLEYLRRYLQRISVRVFRGPEHKQDRTAPSVGFQEIEEKDGASAEHSTGEEGVLFGCQRCALRRVYV